MSRKIYRFFKIAQRIERWNCWCQYYFVSFKRDTYKDAKEVAEKFGVKEKLIERFIKILKYEETTNRRSKSSLANHLKNEIKWGIEFENLKPRDYGYGRRKQFYEDLNKLANLTLEDLIV